MDRLRTLSDLPLELLLMIKENIGQYDLLGNVCYYQLCPETRVCYDETRIVPAFWLDLLWMNGLGRLDHENYAFSDDCLRIAIECAEHAWSCSHSACGVAQLKENERLMQDACQEWADWDHRSAILETEVDQGCFTPTSIFGNISFNNKFRARYYQKLMQGVDMDIGAVAFLRTPVASDAPAWTRADLLNKHPIAMRTFATLPPLKMVNVLNFHPVSDVENRTGVTVRDVILRLGEWYVTSHPALWSLLLMTMLSTLHNEFSVPDLSERLSMITNAPREGIFPSTWSVADVLAAVPNVGNLFQLVNWAGLQYEENDGMYRWFSCDFEYKPLPASVETHLRQYDPDATFSSKSGRAHINAGVQTDA